MAYTVREKLLLTSLVDNYKLVEDKRTDATTIQTKKAEWEKISREYNSQAHIITVKRSAMQLKKLWSNLKQRKRKETTNFKYNMFLTGGGPPPKKDEDPVMEAVAIAAPHMDVTMDCQWDSNSLFQNSQTSTDQNKETFIEANASLTAGCSITTEIPSTSTLTVVVGNDSADVCEPTDVVVGCSSQAADNMVACSSSSKTPTIVRSISDDSSMKFAYNPGVAESMLTPKENKLAAASGRKRIPLVENECTLRLKKMREGIEQQAELHSVKMRIEEKQLETAIAIYEKEKAERDLAVLKLELFKNQNNL